MFTRWYFHTSVATGTGTGLFLCLLVVAISPLFAATLPNATAADSNKPDEPNKPAIAAIREPADVKYDPNLPPDPNLVLSDSLELSYGTTIAVKVVSVTLSAMGKERSWSRDTIRGVTLSNGCQAVLAVKDGKQIPGTLARAVVSTKAGNMVFDRDEVRAIALNTKQAQTLAVSEDSPLLVQNLLFREAAIERLRMEQQTQLAACSQKYEKPIADAKAKVDAARQSHKMAKDALARVRSDLTKREAEQTAYFSRNGKRDTQLGYAIRHLADESRERDKEEEAAAVRLKDAEAAHAALVKARNDEQRTLHRSLPAAIARVQAQAAKHDFIIRSGGSLSENAMRRAFDAVKSGEPEKGKGIISPRKHAIEMQGTD